MGIANMSIFKIISFVISLRPLFQEIYNIVLEEVVKQEAVPVSERSEPGKREMAKHNIERVLVTRNRSWGNLPVTGQMIRLMIEIALYLLRRK